MKRWFLLLVLLLSVSGVHARDKRREKPRPGTEGKQSATSVRGTLALAQRTLAYVEKSAPRPRMAAELAALAKSIDRADPKALQTELAALRRRIILSHPALDFDRLLINKTPPPLYSHNCDQYLGRHSRSGPGIVILEDWKSDHPSEAHVLRGKLPVGSVNKPKLSWDAKRVLFAFCDHTEKRKDWRRFFIYEAAMDGSWVRQITGTEVDPLERWGGRMTSVIEDNDPAYLPDGGIAFVSTRCQSYGRCHNGRYTPSLLLHRVERDGSRLRQISFGEANEADPAVLPDGRVVYTRWEYVNRNVTKFHMLWSTRPDGTGAANFYGNNTERPWMLSETVPIPGSHKVVALATGHHSFSTGCIVRIDPLIGQDEAPPLTRITPEVAFFEAERYTGGGCYSTPWPLTEDLFLAAWSPSPIPGQGKKPADNYAIYLVDSLGGRELIYRDTSVSCSPPRRSSLGHSRRFSAPRCRARPRTCPRRSSFRTST